MHVKQLSLLVHYMQDLFMAVLTTVLQGLGGCVCVTCTHKAGCSEQQQQPDSPLCCVAMLYLMLCADQEDPAAAAPAPDQHGRVRAGEQRMWQQQPPGRCSCSSCNSSSRWRCTAVQGSNRLEQEHIAGQIAAAVLGSECCTPACYVTQIPQHVDTAALVLKHSAGSCTKQACCNARSGCSSSMCAAIKSRGTCCPLQRHL